jgi:hypothetical protein
MTQPGLEPLFAATIPSTCVLGIVAAALTTTSANERKLEEDLVSEDSVSDQEMSTDKRELE